MIRAMRRTTQFLNESYDVFKDLKRVTTTDGPLKSDQVTDGRGNTYEIPTSGVTGPITYREFQYRYNYATRQLEMLYNNRTVVDSMNLDAQSFIDNPQYWIAQHYDEMVDEVKNRI